MPIFKGRNGEILPSRRNPRGNVSGEEESIFIKKMSLLCPICRKAFREFFKNQNSAIPKTCDKCKENMKDLLTGIGKIR